MSSGWEHSERDRVCPAEILKVIGNGLGVLLVGAIIVGAGVVGVLVGFSIIMSLL